MRNTMLMAMLASTGLATAAMAEENSDWYAAARLGLNWSHGEGIEGAFRSKDDRDIGWAAAAAFGRDFKPMRVEFEYMLRRNAIDSLFVRADGGAGAALGLAPLAGDTALADNHVNASTFMLNAIYDVPVLDGFRPYIGAGLGVAVVDLDYQLAGSEQLLRSSKADLAFQGLAGVSYPVSDALTAELGYRFLVTPQMRLRVAGGSEVDAKYKAHSLLIGLRYAFGGKASPQPAEAAPAATPTPAAPAMPANRAPIAGNDRVRVESGFSVDIDVLGNDSDPDGRIAGIATIGDAAHGTVSRNADGTLRYAPAEGFVGSDRFDYVLQDDRGAVATATVSIDVLAPVIGPFLVFFNFDSAELTAEARTIVDEAAAAWRKYGAVRISVVGHTDRSGPDSYNQRLSERRAEAVKAALTAAGVPADRVFSSAKGESEPLVATGDGVREPQNRRVEILFPDSES